MKTAENGSKEVADDKSPFDAPSISLPKGGGAIRGIGEKFAANPVTGTGSVTVPIYTSPGRSGFGPQLALSYDSGAGNGAFGFGWTLTLPSITRKTDKGLPRYQDADESDVFILSGAEDLVPALIEENGEWKREEMPLRTINGKPYRVQRYRPRIEGLFARIERWTAQADPQDTFWRSISKDNITTWYGRTAESRIVDPADAARIFSWLICESHDDKGNVILYTYKKEDASGIDLAQAHERNRKDTRSVNRYLKRIQYGNRIPYYPTYPLDQPPAAPAPDYWMFELVFDYGEHDPQTPLPQEGSQKWDCREDPFSAYRAGFEVRTYRLCQRALMFHRFPNEPDVGQNCLVRSTDFTYSYEETPADPRNLIFSFLLAVTQTGYRRDSNGYFSKSLPPLEFNYTQPVIDATIREIDSESLKNLPYGLDGANYQWVDLDGEGVSGILSEQAGSWFYKRNLSPVNLQSENGKETVRARFGPIELIAQRPSLAALGSGRQQLLDLKGDGQLDLVQFDGPTPGFYERTEDEGWDPFATITSLPVLDWSDPNLKFVDLTGDGHADILISEDSVFRWHSSLAEFGFGPEQRAPQAFDEESGPKLLFADSTQSTFLADLSGDGLTDLVRIRNGEVCYWPNLGYGRFGAKVTMDNAPWFEAPNLFDGRRIRLADIDGSGATDLIYLAGGGVQIYFNQSGNAWTEKQVLGQFPPVESVSSVNAIDLLGNGTACLVWSSALPGNVSRPMRYIDLMGGQKPHLLVQITNNLGAETLIQYAPSTKFYVADKLAERPWVTRLPFPVQVVERMENIDYLSRTRLVTRYAYHHGFYDGVEREFRGFGMVEQFDSEGFEEGSVTAVHGFLATPISAAVAFGSAGQPFSPPACIKTWFHTGAYLGKERISKYFEEEYYHEGDASDATGGLTDQQLEAMLLDDTVLPTNVSLPDGTRIPYDMNSDETREAVRALKGSILRQETYGLDGTDAADRPYTTSERNYTIEVLQPQGANRHAVFFAHARETIDFHYERKIFKVSDGTIADPNNLPPDAKDAADPRVTQAVTLAVDPFGNVLQSLSIGYGRRYRDPALAQEEVKQNTILLTYTENGYTNAILEDDVYRTPLVAEARTFELINVTPDPGTAQPDVTNLFRFEEMIGQVQEASANDIPYEDVFATNVPSGQPSRRIIEHLRTLYRPNDLGIATGDPHALLALGKLESMALPGVSYKLALTPGLLAQVYRRGEENLLPVPAEVLGGRGGDRGNYVDLDDDGHWWIPSGRVFHHPDPGATAKQELDQARQHYFLPRRFEDPFGIIATVDFDDVHDLLIVRSADAASNIVTAINDYRILQPSVVTDPNENRSAVSLDALGLVAGTAMMGKATDNRDSFETFAPDLRAQQIGDFFDADDPHSSADTLLGTATTRIIYDVNRFRNTRGNNPNDPSKWEPVFAATLARETHTNDPLPQSGLKIQISFSYSDGFGREIQKKIQAEPGPIVEGGPIIDPRWVGSGWTIFNNKGKPVRQYEPFFSQFPIQGHRFEFGIKIGVSPILCYDPVERVVATIHPNHTYEKVVFDPWHQETWDVNDTVIADPKSDPDVASFFVLLPDGDYLPTWHAQRIGGTPEEQDAAAKAAAHANTPSVAHFDTLGRTFLTIANNRFERAGTSIEESYPSRVTLDIEGNQREMRDAIVQAGDLQGRIVMRYDYDMLGNRIHQASMEAGERWMVNDVAGKPIRAWNSRGHAFRTEYDLLRRPDKAFVQGADTENPSREILFERTVYGEGQPSDKTLNLRTRVFKHFDTAGVVTSESYDFKGNLVSGSREVAPDYKGLIDWNLAQPSGEAFSTSTIYDALNRPIAVTTPDQSVHRPIYNEANLLERVDVNLQGAAVGTAFVTNIDYNAKGQRTRIDYGNGASTTYEYDLDTFRLVHLNTNRGGAALQGLGYTYDPIGNITHIQDTAQQTVYFNNQVVSPDNDYTYDAVYRLIEASGREHIGQLAQPETTWNDEFRVDLPHPQDGQAMRNYTEEYAYDAVGNFEELSHLAVNGGWTRSYSYNEPSQLEPATKKSNRLSGTTVGRSTGDPSPETYEYDVHGNMTQMPHLTTMQWDFKDQLHGTSRQAVNSGTPETTYYVYDTSGQRVRKVTERQNGSRKEERIYVGGFEVYREYDGQGNTLTLERETLHVMDAKQRIASVETRAQGDDGPSAQLIRNQFCNHLGSASLELDDQAQIISYEEYYPYGSTSYQAVNAVIKSAAKRYRYTGKERDEETGLNYHSARYYASWLGRWTACDPVGAGQSSAYEYCSSKPINYSDLSGLDEDPVRGVSYAGPGDAAGVSRQGPYEPPKTGGSSIGYSPKPKAPPAEQLSSSAKTLAPPPPLEQWLASSNEVDKLPTLEQGYYDYTMEVTKEARRAAALANAYPALAPQIEGAQRQEFFLKAAPFLIPGAPEVGLEVRGTSAVELSLEAKAANAIAPKILTTEDELAASLAPTGPAATEPLPRMSDRAIAQHHLYNVNAANVLNDVPYLGNAWRRDLGNLNQSGLVRSLADNPASQDLYLGIEQQPGQSVPDLLHTGSGTGKPFGEVTSMNPATVAEHRGRWYWQYSDPLLYPNAPTGWNIWQAPGGQRLRAWNSIGP